MSINVRQIAIQFPIIYRETDQAYYPDLDFVGVLVECDKGTKCFPLPLTAEMKNKIFQAEGAEGEFIRDLSEAIKSFVNSQEV